MWASIRAVVVLPLVPVTAAIGIRLGVPGGNSMSITGPPTSRGPPLARRHVHPEPGRRVDLADGAADLLVGLGDVGGEEVDAAHVEADRLYRANRHLDVVGMDQVGHVDGGAAGGEIAGRAEKDPLTVGRNRLPGVALVGEQGLRLVIEHQPGEHLLVTDAAPGVPVHLVHQLLDGVDPVAHHVSRHPLRHRHQLAVDHQHPVVLAGDEALHDDAPAVLPGDVERGAHLVGVGEVDRDPPSVVGVERLHHHRVADPLGGLDRVFRGLHQPLLRHRQAEVAEDAVGLFLVGGQLDGDVRGAAGDGCLDPLLVAAVAELDQALVVEPDPGNPPLLRRPHQRHGAGAERAPLGKPDELVPLGRKVEPLRHRALGPELAGEQGVEQGEAELAGLEAHVLLLVLVDDVVMCRGAVGAGLSRR